MLLIDWAGFNVSTKTVEVIWETVLQVKRPNQQYQNTQMTQKYDKRTGTQKHSKSPSLHWYGVTKGWVPQRAGSPSLNGGGAAHTRC